MLYNTGAMMTASTEAIEGIKNHTSMDLIKVNDHLG